jgi:hypothetical protein
MDMDTSVYYLSCHGGNPVGTDETFETTIGFYTDFGEPLDDTVGLMAVQADVEPLYKFGPGTGNPGIPNMDLEPQTAAEKETGMLAFGQQNVEYLKMSTTLHDYIRQFEGIHGSGHELRVIACTSRDELKGKSPRTRDKDAPQGWRSEDANKDSRRFIEDTEKTKQDKNEELISLADKDWNAAVKAILKMPRLEKALAANRSLLRFPVLYAMAWTRRPRSADVAGCNAFLQKLMWEGTQDAEDFSASLKTAWYFSQMSTYFAEDCRNINAAMQEASQRDWDRIKNDPAWKLFISVMSTQEMDSFKLPGKTWNERLTAKALRPPEENRDGNTRQDRARRRDNHPEPESMTMRREFAKLAAEETAERYRRNQPQNSRGHRNYSRDPYPTSESRDRPKH